MCNLQLEIDRVNSENIPSINGFDSYVEQISENFCPYIEPSFRRGNNSYSVISCDTSDKMLAESIIFASGLALTELLRIKKSKAERMGLFCQNALFQLPNIDISLGEEILSWPHWVLKTRYTSLGIMFGKFWKDAEEEAKDGRNLPSPPCHFLSVRESVQSKDPQFFDRASWLRPLLKSSSDEGQQVFQDVSVSDRLIESLDLFCSQPTCSKLQDVLHSVVESEVYLEVRDIAEEELRSRKQELKPKGE